MSVLGLAAQRSPLQVEALRWVALWWALMRLLGQVLPCSQE